LESSPTPRSPSAPAAGPSSGLVAGDATGLAATAEALAETQRLIEKASSRSLPPDHQPELVFPGYRSSRRRERRGAGDGLAEAGPDTATRASSAPMPLSDIFLAEEPAALQVRIGEADEPLARARWAPLVFLSLLGLMAAVALIYLVRYAGDSGTGATREIASPHRLLLPATSWPAAATTVEELPVEMVADPVAPAAGAFQALATDEPAGGPEALPGTSAAIPPAASAAGNCRRELRALNLCGKVNPTP
jgi:hypothetical protein